MNIFIFSENLEYFVFLIIRGNIIDFYIIEFDVFGKYIFLNLIDRDFVGFNYDVFILYVIIIEFEIRSYFKYICMCYMI